MATLAACTLFQGLPDKELKAVEREFSEVAHPAGEEVILHGERGLGFMVILDGEATVSIPDGRTGRLKPGDFMGEMALLDHQSRSATVTAETDLKVAALPSWSFRSFLTAHPEVCYRMLEVVSRRLREAQQA